MAERTWYAQQTIENGWSRNILIHQIESNLFHRKGKAITNFAKTLPAPQSELAQQIVKDPYNFDFLSLGVEAKERDLERGLIAQAAPAVFAIVSFRRESVSGTHTAFASATPGTAFRIYVENQ